MDVCYLYNATPAKVEELIRVNVNEDDGSASSGASGADSKDKDGKDKDKDKEKEKEKGESDREPLPIRDNGSCCFACLQKWRMRDSFLIPSGSSW